MTTLNLMTLPARIFRVVVDTTRCNRAVAMENKEVTDKNNQKTVTFVTFVTFLFNDKSVITLRLGHYKNRMLKLRVLLFVERHFFHKL